MAPPPLAKERLASLPPHCRGWKELAAQLHAWGTVAVAVETSQGLAVGPRLAHGFIVYPVNPNSAQPYRERKSPCGVKSEQLDAGSLGDARRLDGPSWKPLSPEDPLVAEWRWLARDEVALKEQRTALVNLPTGSVALRPKVPPPLPSVSKLPQHRNGEVATTLRPETVAAPQFLEDRLFTFSTLVSHCFADNKRT